MSATEGIACAWLLSVPARVTCLINLVRTTSAALTSPCMGVIPPLLNTARTRGLFTAGPNAARRTLPNSIAGFPAVLRCVENSSAGNYAASHACRKRQGQPSKKVYPTPPPPPTLSERFSCPRTRELSRLVQPCSPSLSCCEIERSTHGRRD